VGVIFDGKKGKRVDDAPAEGNKSKEPQQKHKRGKKPRREARAGMRQRRGRGLRYRSGPQGPSSGPSRPRCVQRHAEEAVPVPQYPS
jgi:hypothetical protein